MTNEVENQYKVRLSVATQYAAMNTDIANRRNRSVSFKVSPDVTENRNVNYKTLDPLHMPGQIYVYGGTSSRTFQLSNIRLISRTTKEATENMRTLHLLRSWTMPYFGNSSTLSETQTSNRGGGVGAVAGAVGSAVGAIDELTSAGNNAARNVITDLTRSGGNETSPTDKPEGKDGKGMELLGAPPDVLLLSAYSPNSDFTTKGQKDARRRMSATNIHNVPVVVTNLTIPYPSDVDYIPTDDGQPMPRMMTIDIQLAETHSPQEYNKFSIQDFRNGTLMNF